MPKRAIELGFADEILEDEKKRAPAEAYAFGAKEFEAQLVNKISKCDAPASKQGRSVIELRNKLVTIKQYI